LLGADVAGAVVALGRGTVTEPDGDAATALAIAACNRFCAWPYAVKSPFLSASWPSENAF
jgi:hypothetical protein